MHGYGLMDGLRSLGFEEYPVDFSAVYRTLRNLEMEGMVRSDWDLEVAAGPPRRVYTIAPEGEAYLARCVEDLHATDRVLHTFLDAYNAARGPNDEVASDQILCAQDTASKQGGA